MNIPLMAVGVILFVLGLLFASTVGGWAWLIPVLGLILFFSGLFSGPKKSKPNDSYRRH